MNRVAERIEDGRHVPIDPVSMVPDVGHRHRDIFRKCSGPVDPDTQRVFAEMPAARQAVAATSAHYVTLRADRLTREEILHIRANLGNFAYEFMTDDHRGRDGLLGPIIPFV